MEVDTQLGDAEVVLRLSDSVPGRGRRHLVRVRARNSMGSSDWSKQAVIQLPGMKQTKKGQIERNGEDRWNGREGERGGYRGSIDRKSVV